MKFGIDINNSEISREVLSQLKDKGHYVIDMSVIHSKNIGNRLHQKSILANSSKIDFYISLVFVKGIDRAEIYYKEEEGTKDFCLLFLNQLVEYNNKEIMDGHEFYLIKNILAPSVVIFLGEENKSIRDMDIARYIVFSMVKRMYKTP